MLNKTMILLERSTSIKKHFDTFISAAKYLVYFEIPLWDIQALNFKDRQEENEFWQCYASFSKDKTIEPSNDELQEWSNNTVKYFWNW